MKVLGVDPGISGGWALLCPDPKTIIACGHLPTLPRARKGNKLNPHQLLSCWHDLGRIDLAVIEHAQAMPGQGITSTFEYGRSFGTLEGVLAALNIPVQRAKPRDWKKRAGLIGADKDMGRAKVIDLFPERSDDFRLKKDGHKADAVLIALYGVPEGTT